MTRTFTRGEKAKLSDLTPAKQLTIGIGAAGAGGETFEVSCFGLDASGNLSDDRYLVFYNQRSSPEGAIAFGTPAGGDLETFSVDLDRLPPSVVRLAFTATIDGQGTMSSMRAGHLRIASQGSEVARFPLEGSSYTGERALIVGEVYLKDVWRFSAVGQGFNGGLSALLTHFGGEEAAPAPVPAAPPAPPPPPPAPVNLKKVTLDKKGDQRTVSLRKDGGVQPIHVNLNWDQTGRRKRGLLASLAAGSAPDLDLGCMWELKDGSRGVIQPLGKKFGRRDAAPWIYLDKDDRSGAAADGENLYVLRPDQIARVMVFALIYEGAPDFTSVGGRMMFRDQDGNETTILLNNPDRNRTFCAVCTIVNGGSSVVITKEERYFRSHAEADRHYGFGFRWGAGRK